MLIGGMVFGLVGAGALVLATRSDPTGGAQPISSGISDLRRPT